MNIGDSPLGKFIEVNVKLVTGFFDMAYKQNWLFYLIVGLIAFAVVVIMFN